MESADNTCSVCHEHVEFYAIGSCDHPICFKCSTRMRALCDQFYCPICRTDLQEVFFLTTKEKFGEMPIRKFIWNRKLKIQFENETVRDRFEQLLELKCPKCPERYPEKSFKALRDHMRRVHTLFYCDLCLELKIFSSERKVYNRQELATHRRIGDKDDKSYKGHPLCQFCEERYLDKDELYKHLRKDHYFCHFCESLGSQEFYNDYPVLKDHFRSDHYLCEEGECMDAEFTNAFRSDIDFKSHQAQYHSKATNKLQARQERTINIDINLAPRPHSRPHRGGRDSQVEYDGARRQGPRHQGSRGGRGGKHSNPTNRERDDIDRAIQASLSTMNDADMKRDVKEKSSEQPKRSGVELSQNQDNFPTLGGKSDSAPTTSSSSVVSTSGSVTTNSKSSLADRFAISHSMSVQHGTLNDFPTLASSARSDSPKNVPPSRGGLGNNFASANKQKPVVEDFPELLSGKNIKKSAPGTWVKAGSSVNERDKSANNHSKKSHSSKTSVKTDYNVNDFPTLGAPSNASVNRKWFSGKVSEPPPNNTRTSKILEDDHSESSNIIDRFSPVNVPDSPKTDKSKNKKKKKKDKVTEIKTGTAGGSVRGNNSLDDIASLLISDSNLVKSESVVTQNGFDKAPKVKQEKSKGKKKEDKVEKKLENEKSVENKFEELNLYGGLDDATSELLKSEPVKLTNAVEEYPALGSSSAPRKPPPGFSAEVEVTKSAAPPGFRKTSSYQPPPGFGSQNQTQVSFPEREIIPMSTDFGNFEYAQPGDFQDRNRQLIGAIQAYCDRDQVAFSDFKHISGEFRRSEISARIYYERCEEILGEKNFSEVFPELLALLPDINKQNELLSVFMKSGSIKNDDKVLKISGRSRNAKGAWTVAQSGFLSCPTCRQVLSRKDYNLHISMHDLNSDFPSLSGTKVPTSKYTGGSWVKA